MPSFSSTDVYDVMKEKRQFVSIRDGSHREATVLLDLYLEALDEELVALQSSIGTHRPTSILKVEGLEEETQSGEGQTEVGEQDDTVSSVKTRISHIFGGRSRTTVRAPGQPDIITPEDWRSLKLNIQPDSVHTIQDALAHISQPVQVGQSNSSEANQRVQIEALPPILILHLERFLYDTVADGTNKISKPIRFPPELEIPPEIMAPMAEKSLDPAHYKLYGFYITTASPEAAGTILSTCSRQTETVVVGRLGCTLKMKLLVLCGTRTYLGVMAVGGGRRVCLFTVYCATASTQS
ncbi:hypothetical protein BJV77DRAFT_774473 [Russula vinacea]|nr:hypothetical protein BJV77DRAFT_774473 [Russula vinacea]